MCSIKEPDYFCSDVFETKGAWYESLFVEKPDAKAVGDVSPCILATPLAAKRIHSYIPDAKLIFILRNPIERLYSQFYYALMRGIVSPNVDFSGFIRNVDEPFNAHYIEIGQYYSHLQKFRSFFSEAQILILLFEDFKSDLHGVLANIYSYIGVDISHDVDTSKRHNETKYFQPSIAYRLAYTVGHPLKRIVGETFLDKTSNLRSTLRNKLTGLGHGTVVPNIPLMKPEDRLYLQDVYSDSNRKLASIIRPDISHWN